MGSYYNSSSTSLVMEKAELQRLNDRLAVYIQQMRDSSEGDSQSFRKSVKNIEDDVRNLKNVYEKELEKLRRQLDAANKDKNDYQSQSERNKQAAAEFESKYRTGFEKNRTLTDEINKLRDTVASLEARLHEAKSAAKGPAAEAERLQRELNATNIKTQEYCRRLEQDSAAKNQANDRNSELQKKLDFNDKRHEAELREKQAQLDQATKMIKNLEDKTREMDKMGGSMPEIVRRIRESTERDLKNYQKESDENFKKNLAALKSQLDQQNAINEQLKGDNKKLRDTNEALMERFRAFESQIRDLQEQNKAKEDALKQERARSAEQVRAMDCKVRDLQEKLVALMKECNADKDVNVSMKAEIEAMKALLEDEERRLKNAECAERAERAGGAGDAGRAGGSPLYRASQSRGSSGCRSNSGLRQSSPGKLNTDNNQAGSKSLRQRQYTPLTTYRAGYCQPRSFATRRTRPIYPATESKGLPKIDV